MSTADRDRALEKVRKLLSMANDGRGNVQEAETAARQAAALMEKYNIEAAEAQLEDLCGDQPDLAQELYVADYDPGAKNTPKQVPMWVNVTAFGVARLCQVKVDIISIRGNATIRFSGYATDVAFAQWLMPMLCRAIFNQARVEWGNGTRAEREAFRRGAASRLQNRMIKLRDELDAATRENKSAGTALMVLDKKKEIILHEFGGERSKTSMYKTEHGEAMRDGNRFGDRLNIPMGRPLEGSKSGLRLK